LSLVTQLGLPAISAFALFRKHEQSLTAPLAPIWNCERKNKRSMLGKRNTDILEWGKSRWQRTVFRAPALPGLTGAQKQLFGAPAQEVLFQPNT
jgi:hypothetical protein